MSTTHFAAVGLRQLAAEALLQAARSIAASSREADFERAWLRGETAGGAITARDCLDAILGDAPSHAGDALIGRFIAALAADDLRLIASLEQLCGHPRADDSALDSMFERLLDRRGVDVEDLSADPAGQCAASRSAAPRVQ